MIRRRLDRGSLARQLLLPALSAVLLLVVLAIPDLGPARTDTSGITAYHARLVAVLDPNRPDRALASGGFGPDGRVLMLEGPDAGQELDAYLQGPGGQQDNTGYRVGEDVVVTSTGSGGSTPFVAVQDRWRLPQLIWLAALFGVAVVAAGGWRGLRALLALGLTVAITIRILVPLLLVGVSPIPVAVVLSVAITILTIGLTEGFSRSSVAAILGTAGALGFTAILAAGTIAAAQFSNAVGQELISLQVAPGVGLDLRGLLLAAFMLGTIGVLDDVTVTQAAAVEELVRHTQLRGRQLYASAFNVGRSHIAATVNTLFLAYLGASLPLIVLFAVTSQPTGLILNGETVAIEIVRTLVGSLGIVAAVPLTTVLAVALAPHRDADAQMDRSGLPRLLRHPAIALVAGLLTIGLITGGVAVAISPFVAAPQRLPVAVDQFGPITGASPAASVQPVGTELPAGPAPLIQIGTTMPVVDGGAALGSVTVLEERTETDGTGRTRLLLNVVARASGSFAVSPASWTVLASDGTIVTGQGSQTHPPLTDVTLKAGQETSGWLEIETSTAQDVFVHYVGPSGIILFTLAIFPP